MRENLDRMKGLVYSQSLLLALAKAGMPREEAYDLVQRAAMRVWAGEGTFLEMVSETPAIVQTLDRRTLRACFDPARHLRYVSALLRRVFGRAARPGRASAAGRTSSASAQARAAHTNSARKHAAASGRRTAARRARDRSSRRR